MKRRLFAFSCWLLPAVSLPAGDFFLKGGETIVFLGDSITQDGRYVEYIEAYFATQFPEKELRVVYAGLSSETISGTSEPDHTPRRPYAHDRFARDVVPHQPDVVVACYGMNDGNYHPFDAERFAKFQAGVRLLLHRVKTETKARLVLVTPPPFDPYRRAVGDSSAVEYGYKFPAVDYDETLRRYSEWLLTLRGEGITVADVHSRLAEHLKRRRASRVSFSLAEDAVHPGPTGHWLMAMAILDAWGAPPPQELSPALEDDGGKGLRATWTAPLPPPVDPAWDVESALLEKKAGGLWRQRMTLKGLSAPSYELRVDGKRAGEVSSRDFEAGLDILVFPELPANQRSAKVLELVRRKRREKPEAVEIAVQIKELCCPKPVAISLVPVKVPAVSEAIGVNIHFTGAPARDLDLIRDAGFGWIRMDFAWQAIEREKGSYRFDEYDQLLDGLASRGLRALFILDYSNRLHEESQSVRTPAGREAFARFAAASAARYKGRGVRWEIWNEPNLAQFWKPEPSPEDYAKLVIEAAKAIRAADGDAVVLAPASSGFPWSFLETVFRNGLLQHVDEVSVHPYRAARPETVRDDYVRLHELLGKSAPKDRKPPAIVSGEWGYSTWHHGGVPFSEEVQASYLARAFLTNLSEGIPLSIWYDWANDGSNPRETEHNFGTVTEDRRPKPAYLAAKTMTSILGRARFARRLKGAPEDHFLVFEEASVEKLAAWTEGVPHPVAMGVPGWSGTVQLTAFTGAVSLAEAKDGFLELSLEERPVYVELPAGSGGLAVHGLSADLFADHVRVRAHRGGPGAADGAITVEIGTGELRTKVGLKVALDEAKDESAEFPASWSVSSPARLGVSLRDVSTQQLLAALPEISCAAVKAFHVLWPAAGELKTFQVALDGDAAVDGEAVVYSRAVGSRGGKKTATPGDSIFSVGTKVLTLEYRFGKGWKFVRVVPAAGLEEIPGKPSALSVWVKGDGHGNSLRCRFRDARGETFQPTAGAVGWGDWKRVSIPLDGRDAKSWGGGEDGRVDHPIAWDSIFLIDSTREASTGAIQLASPVLVYPPE